MALGAIGLGATMMVGVSRASAGRAARTAHVADLARAMFSLLLGFGLAGQLLSVILDGPTLFLARAGWPRIRALRRFAAVAFRRAPSVKRGSSSCGGPLL